MSIRSVYEELRRHASSEDLFDARQLVPICSKCHTSELMTKIFTCSRCHLDFYCSKSCQKKDWKQHKIHCHSNSSSEDATDLFYKVKWELYKVDPYTASIEFEEKDGELTLPDFLATTDTIYTVFARVVSSQGSLLFQGSFRRQAKKRIQVEFPFGRSIINKFYPMSNETRLLWRDYKYVWLSKSDEVQAIWESTYKSIQEKNFLLLSDLEYAKFCH